MKDKVKKEINTQLKRITALTVMCSVCVVSAVSVGAFSKRVKITDGEKVISVVTMNNETEKILEQAGISISNNDAVLRKDETNNTVDITLRRAFDVGINFDGNSITEQIAFGCVSDVLTNAGVEIGEHDAVTPSLDTQLEEDMQINIERRCGINVHADGRTKEYSVPLVSVNDAIKYAEIPLSDDDVLSVDKSTNVYDGMEFSIERIGYRNLITTEEVPFQTTTKKTDLLEEGITQVATKGVNGEREIIIKETVSDGNVVKIEQVKDKITVAPINEVVLLGTKNKNQTVQVSAGFNNTSSNQIYTGYSKDNNNGTIIDHYGKTISYKSKIVGSCTAYTSDPGAITSTGKVAKYGYVAVNPNVIPYGTKMYIASPDGRYVYGYAIAADTGGALMSGRVLVDLYYDNVQQCYNFGRRNMNVYILK